MAENRIDREQDTRVAKANKKAWVRPELIPTPVVEEGYGARWIRVSTLGTDDASNLSQKLREGWVPCKGEDHPELKAAGSIDAQGNVVQGGLMLCKAPIEMVQERDAYYKAQADSQMRSVDHNLMREQDSRMPIFNDRKSEQFGTG